MCKILSKSELVPSGCLSGLCGLPRGEPAVEAKKAKKEERAVWETSVHPDPDQHIPDTNSAVQFKAHPCEPGFRSASFSAWRVGLFSKYCPEGLTALAYT
jgi:hypothetical protein